MFLLPGRPLSDTEDFICVSTRAQESSDVSWAKLSHKSFLEIPSSKWSGTAAVERYESKRGVSTDTSDALWWMIFTERDFMQSRTRVYFMGLSCKPYCMPIYSNVFLHGCYFRIALIHSSNRMCPSILNWSFVRCSIWGPVVHFRRLISKWLQNTCAVCPIKPEIVKAVGLSAYLSPASIHIRSGLPYRSTSLIPLVVEWEFRLVWYSVRGAHRRHLEQA